MLLLAGFQRKEFSKEFGGELRRLGDLFDKDPNVRKKLNPQDESDGIKLRRAADEFDLLVSFVIVLFPRKITSLRYNFKIVWLVTCRTKMQHLWLLSFYVFN